MALPIDFTEATSFQTSGGFVAELLPEDWAESTFHQTTTKRSEKQIGVKGFFIANLNQKMLINGKNSILHFLWQLNNESLALVGI